jgi:hypothetical protein
MSRDIAICLYGPQHYDTSATRYLCQEQLSSKFNNVAFYEHVGDSDPYKNLWLVSHKKRIEEINMREDYVMCLAIDASYQWPDNKIPIHIFSGFSLRPQFHEKLYYLQGGINLPRGATAISLTGFFASSLIFDLACNYGLVRGKLPPGIKASSIEEEFYHYVKSLKIKTECVNYEDSSLFKRTT